MLSESFELVVFVAVFAGLVVMVSIAGCVVVLLARAVAGDARDLWHRVVAWWRPDPRPGVIVPDPLGGFRLEDRRVGLNDEERVA